MELEISKPVNTHYATLRFLPLNISFCAQKTAAGGN